MAASVTLTDLAPGANLAIAPAALTTTVTENDGMNWAYVHLLINHIPVILAPLGFVAAILALITRRRAVWLYALASLTLAGISAYPVMATGDEASDVVRRAIPNVNRDAIEKHEDTGDTTMWILLAGGVVAAYAWWRLGRAAERLPTWLVGLVLLTGAASTVGVTLAALEGGEILHKEAHIAPSSLPPAATIAPGAAEDHD